MSILLLTIISFSRVFLRGIQHQNINKGKYKLAFGLSYLMAIFDVLVIGFVVKMSIVAILPVGTGSSLGIITSMYIHRKYIK